MEQLKNIEKSLLEVKNKKEFNKKYKQYIKEIQVLKDTLIIMELK